MIRLRCAPAGVPKTEVLIGAGTSRALAEHLAVLGHGPRFFLCDQQLLDLHPHLRPLPDVPSLAIEAGEHGKILAKAEHVLRALAARALGRDTRLVTVGGGTACDLGGFVASIYLRGIEHALVPTTLLAILDASVGGKTAVNLPEGKNLAGTFWPPRVVVADLDLVRTQSDVEFRSGLAEALKIAIGLDGELFAFLRAQAQAVLRRDVAALETVVGRAVGRKIEIVEQDPRESGARRLLNLGHTLGHALEAHSVYELPHGFAVARGIHFAIDVGQKHGVLADEAANEMRSLLVRYGFKKSALPPWRGLEPYLLRDKKATAGGVRLVLPTSVGASDVVTVQDFASCVRDAG